MRSLEGEKLQKTPLLRPEKAEAAAVIMGHQLRRGRRRVFFALCLLFSSLLPTMEWHLDGDDDAGSLSQAVGVIRPEVDDGRTDRRRKNENDFPLLPFPSFHSSPPPFKPTTRLLLSPVCHSRTREEKEAKHTHTHGPSSSPPFLLCLDGSGGGGGRFLSPPSSRYPVRTGNNTLKSNTDRESSRRKERRRAPFVRQSQAFFWLPAPLPSSNRPTDHRPIFFPPPPFTLCMCKEGSGRLVWTDGGRGAGRRGGNIIHTCRFFSPFPRSRRPPNASEEDDEEEQSNRYSDNKFVYGKS